MMAFIPGWSWSPYNVAMYENASKASNENKWQNECYISQVKHFGGGVLQPHIYLTRAVTNQKALAALATGIAYKIYFLKALYIYFFY